MSPIKARRWNVLDKLHKQRADQAAAKVIAQRAIVYSEKTKLEQLQAYALEYAAEKSTAQSATLLDNSRKFFAKLSQVVTHQKKILETHQRNLEHLEKKWVQLIKKQKSYALLFEEEKKKAFHEQAKQEQHALDEWSARRGD